MDVTPSTTDPASTDGQVVQNVPGMCPIPVHTVTTDNAVSNRSTIPVVIQAVRPPIPNPCPTVQLRDNRDPPLTPRRLHKILHRIPHVSFFDEYYQRMMV